MRSELERRQFLHRLLGDLLDAPVGQRSTILSQNCGDDTSLAADAAALLDAALREDTSLRTGGALSPGIAETLEEGGLSSSLGPGMELGRYRLVRELGRGGMGVVFLAERSDGLFERQVALKVVRLDTSDRARFMREQQILARLVHPGIARLYDGGVTEEGDPYFVMEHVEGERIDHHCDGQGLGMRDRLRLLASICAAVEAAHRQLIVHCDIKPSNILVDADGEPKLLDFGIAMLMRTAAREPPDPAVQTGAPSVANLTHTQGARLTPQYASPEQLGGGVVTIASDVYQLGLLAYELLAGERPFERALESASGTASSVGPEESRQRLAEQEPLPPSSRSPNLRGTLAADVDAMVLKALDRRPEARYSSADRLREDLERCLERRPVLARPQTLAYRLRCLVTRRPLAMAATLLAALLLPTFTWRLADERDATRAQAERAELALEESEEVVQFLTGLFEVADPGRSIKPAGEETTARELLDRGSERLDHELQDRPRVRARLLTVSGDIYRRLGLYDQSEPLLRESMALGEAMNDRDGQTASWLALGTLRSDQGDYPAAGELLERVLAVVDAGTNRSLLGQALDGLGYIRYREGRFDEALELYRRALDEWHFLGLRHNEAMVMMRIGNVLGEKGHKKQERRLIAEAVGTLAEIHGAEHPSLAVPLVNLANLHAQFGDVAESVPLYERALALLTASFDADHPDAIKAHGNLGIAYLELERFEDAERELGQAIAAQERVGSGHPDLAEMISNMGNVELELGRPAAAEAQYRRSLELTRNLLPEGHPQVGLVLNNLGEALLAQGRSREAQPHLIESREIFVASLGESHALVSYPLLHLARIEAELGSAEVAEAMFVRALELRRAGEGVDPADVRDAVDAYASFLRTQGRADEAERFQVPTSQ